MAWNEKRLLVLDAGESALRLVETASGEVMTMVGGRTAGHVDGILNTAKLNGPRGMCMHGEGVVIIADTGNAVLRCVEVFSGGSKGTNRISTFAGIPGTKGEAPSAPLACVSSRIRSLPIIYHAFDGFPSSSRIWSLLIISTLLIAPRRSAHHPGAPPLTLRRHCPSCITGAADGWECTLHSPTSVVRLPTGELIIADTGSHTLRLVEVGGKGPLVTSAMEAVSDADVTLRRVSEKRKQQMVGRLTTVAGTAGVAGCADGKPTESLLFAPTSLSLSGKSSAPSVLFLQSGGYGEDGGGPHLLRQLSIGRAATSGKPNERARFIFRVSTLHRFGEAPRRGPTSLIELASNAKELLVADDGKFQLLELSTTSNGPTEASTTPSYVVSDVCDGKGFPIGMPGDAYLGRTSGGMVTVVHAEEAALYRLLTPTIWKKADRKYATSRKR